MHARWLLGLETIGPCTAQPRSVTQPNTTGPLTTQHPYLCHDIAGRVVYVPPSDSTRSMVSESDLRTQCHTPCYCEENVYKLLQHLHQEGAYAVIISNPNEQVPLFYQRAAQYRDGHVVWDYHVIAVRCGAHDSQVLDFDTTLPFATPLAEYVTRAVQPHNPGLAHYPRWFRFVPAREFLANFASDRSHMLESAALLESGLGEDSEDKAAVGAQAGLYKMPPPRHPCIVNAHARTNTLPRYRDMLLDRVSESEGPVTVQRLAALPCTPYGHVLNEVQLCELARDAVASRQRQRAFAHAL